MLKKRWMLVLFLIFVFLLPFVRPDCTYYNYDKIEDQDCDYNSEDFYNMVDYNNAEIDWEQVDQTHIPADRINEVPADKLDFDVLSGEQLGEVTPEQWQESGHDVSSIQGDTDEADVEGDQLKLPDGSSYALNSGSNIDLEIAADGTTKSFSNNAGVSFFNARGVSYSSARLTVVQADSISWFGATTNKVYNFEGQSGTFKIDSADRVIVETMAFDKIKDSVFDISEGNLISAEVTYTKNNSETTFINLIDGSADSIEVLSDAEEGYFVSYREEDNAITFNATEGILIIFPGIYSKITFNSTSNESSLIIKPDGTFEVKQGILSFISGTFTEQLEGNCLGYSVAGVDFRDGFKRTVLLPFKDYSTGVFICPGARYNRIYERKENSFSIYNSGKEPYYLMFDKDPSMFLQAKENNGKTPGYGFISDNLILNGIINYERYPEKELFPGIKEEEYSSLPLEWKKVYAGYEDKINTEIEGQRDIRIISSFEGSGNNVIVEVNSGWFNIKEIQKEESITQYADFNKDIIFPDYVEYFRFNDKPEIRISQKTLEQRGISKEGDEKAVKMFAPGTEKQTEFLDWLKIKTIVKELGEYISKLFE